MSADSRTRPYSTPPPAPPSRSGLNPVTLAIAAISAVAAAIVVSKIWAGGTLMATAMTPVIVAVVKEMLERPAQKIPVTVSRISQVRHSDPDALVVEEVEPGEPSEVSIYSPRGGRKWKLALMTGLAAAIVAIAALTLPELVAGHSIFGSKERTTIFRGHSSKAKTTTTQDTQTQTVTQTVPSQTVTQTVPTVTQTVPAQTQTTPAQTAPAQTTPPSGGATTPTTTTPAP
jgi:hypothetical protein